MLLLCVNGQMLLFGKAFKALVTLMRLGIFVNQLVANETRPQRQGLVANFANIHTILLFLIQTILGVGTILLFLLVILLIILLLFLLLLLHHLSNWLHLLLLNSHLILHLLPLLLLLLLLLL